MKKELKLALISLTAIASLTSCGSTFSGKISFYDDQTLLGTLEGRSGTIIADDAKMASDLASYQTKDGYVFSGWYEAADFSAGRIDVKYIPYTDYTLYARFLKEVNLTFEIDSSTALTYPKGADANSYSGVESEQIKYDLPTASKDLYTFNGWKNKADGSVFSSLSYPSDSLVLIPDFEAWPTLSFETGVTGYTIPSVQVEPGKEVSSALIDSSKFLSTSERRFMGWYMTKTTDEQGNVIYEDRFNFAEMPETDTTIYAYWQEAVQINFHTNAANYTIPSLTGFPGDSVDNSGSKVAAPTLDQTKIPSQKYFDGWYEDETFAAASAPYNFDVMPDQTTELYAKWSDDPTISFIRNIKTGSSETEEASAYASFSDKAPGEEVSLASYSPFDATYTSDKYSFTGFYTLNSSNEKVYLPDQSVYSVGKSSLTIYVELVTLSQVSVQFVDTDGNLLVGISSYTDIYAGEGEESLSKDTAFSKTNAYLKANYPATYGSDLYKLLKFYSSNTAKEETVFPLSVSSGKTIYAVLGKKVSLTIKYVTAVSDSSSSLTPTVLSSAAQPQEGYQSEKVIGYDGLEASPLDFSGQYIKIYSWTSSVLSASYSAQYSFAYVDDGNAYKGSNTYTHYTLPSSYPSSNLTLVIVFVPVE
jgi:uncharacterized repeat protein (TIGR02543 family)